LQKIIDEVLPDLYRAVPDDNLDRMCRYEFVTEGTRGKWDESYNFFRTLPNPSPHGELLEALSCGLKRHKLGTTSFSDRGLFEHILQVVRQHGGADDEPIKLSARKLWHLLQRFSMDAPLRLEQLIARINDFLGHHVEIADDIDGKRRELCGILLEIAAEGAQSITAERLLRKGSIPLFSFRDWPRLQNKLRVRLREQLQKEQYDISLDVRPMRPIHDDLTVLSGESGQGKTWRLARTASELSAGDSLVVWVPSSRGNADVAGYVAHEIWNYGLERDATLTLERVASRRNHSNPNVKSPWAIVCVDDVRSSEEATLLQNLDWNRWGISLVLSTSTQIARSIASSRGLLPSVVKDFDHLELRAYLERRCISWASIARDVLELIRRPILAKVYADIAQGESAFNPRTEYDLMDAAWSRISDPTDIGLIRILAGTIELENPAYPWRTECILEHGGSADSTIRLTKQGWFRDAGDGRVAMWHHRFLYYAYAKYLVARFDSGELSVDELGAALRRCYNHSAPTQLQFGYVPMDALWLVLSKPRSTAEQSELWKLIACLETYGGAGHDDETLYKHLLASLGERIVPLIIARTKYSGDGKHNVVPLRAAEALLIIGRHHPDVVSKIAQECLDHGGNAMSALGLRLIIGFPGSANVDQVWEAYRTQIARDKVDGADYHALELAALAFRKVAANHVAWFKHMLNTCDSNEVGFASLVGALGELAGNDEVEPIWRDSKARLFRAVHPEKRYCLVACIANFEDTNEYCRLEEWATSDITRIGSLSIWALSYRVPERALAVLRNVPVRQLFGTTGHIGNALLSVLPKETSNEIEGLIKERPDDAWSYVEILSGHGDCLNQSTVSALLDWLSNGLRKCLNTTARNDQVHARRGLEVVESLHGSNVLQQLRDRRGSSLEDCLLSFATVRLPMISQWMDHEFRQARQILKRIGGDGFTTLTNRLMTAEQRQLRLQGCEDAVIRPNDDTRKLLCKLALSDEMWESGTNGINLVQMRAIDSMAALGDDAGLVLGIMKWGSKVSPYVGEIRAGQPAMSNEALKPACDLLDKPDSDQFENAILAIGQSGRLEYQEHIETILSRSDFSSSVVQACLLALNDLARDCSRILDRLEDQYRSGHYKFAVLKVLGRCRVPIETYLRLIPDSGPIDDMDERVITFLAGDDKTRPLIEHRVRELIASGGSVLNDIVHLLDPAQIEDRELLWRKSLQPDLGLHIVGSKARAIDVLGRLSIDAAFDVGIESLHTDRRDRDSIPLVLMRLAPLRGIAELCKLAGTLSDKLMCAAIGRAFREVATPEQLRQPIRDLLASGDWKCRRAGAFTAGFLPCGTVDNDLRRVAYSDPRWDVCAEAQRAIRTRQREADAARITTTIGTTPSADLWGAIDSVVRLADPVILSMDSDPIRFWNAIESRPYIIRKYAFNAVKERREQLDKDMASLHCKWKDDI